MKTNPTKMPAGVAAERLFRDWLDPVETGLRTMVRGFIETTIEEGAASFAMPTLTHLGSAPSIKMRKYLWPN